MTNFQFDNKGYLLPTGFQWTTVEELRHHFVSTFPNSEKRLLLFNNYSRFLYRFQNEVFPYFEQWIDGSFVSKKEEPKDIDVVTFLDYRVYKSRGEQVMDKFWCFSLEDQGIDSYLVEVYPIGHPEYPAYLATKKEWEERYSSTRLDAFGNSTAKGFLKINFEK